MADLSIPATPYGMRDIKLTGYVDAAGTVLEAESVDLPIARTLTWTESESFAELRGDDRVAASHGNGAALAWEMESGGIPFEAFKIMAGGEIATSGSGSTLKKVYAKKVTDLRPYFRIEGQAISDSGGDVRTVLHRCKATGDLTGGFTDGEFTLTNASGVGHAMPSGDFADELYQFIHNASVSTFVEPGEEVIP